MLLTIAFAVAPPAAALEQVNACGLGDAGGINNIFAEYETFGIASVNACSAGNDGGLELNQDGVNQVAPGGASGWIATTPPGMTIVGANVPTFYAYGVVGTGYLMHFYWAGSPPQRVVNGPSFTVPVGGMVSSQFGFDLQCNPAGPPCPALNPIVHVQLQDVQLYVAETVNPALNAIGSNNLWYMGPTEYVRGTWSIAYSADAPSGIESMAAWENGNEITSPLPPGCWPDGSGPNQTAWQQCQGTQVWSPTVSLAGNGDQPLTLAATSTAQNTTSPTILIRVDTTPPTISLSGPTAASSSAGTQYVTATATTGPSGLGSIDCSTDGGPSQSYSSSPASIPVSGLGMHSVQCTATNQSYDSQGQPATSPPATWAVDIGQPTLNGISFSKLVDALKCRKAKERIIVSARWVAVHRHGKLLRVHRRAHRRTIKVVKCHPRTATRKVTVWTKEKRNGKTVLVKRRKVERVVVAPHILSKSTERVAHGKGTTVSGWLGTADGIALSGRTVAVMTAPDNGLGQWSQSAVVTTGADGNWSATLPPGPSRLVEAAYAGDGTTLPSASAAIHLAVPAKVKVHILPRSTRWGGRITLSGRVLGGYIPAGKLLRLRIGVEGVRATVGIPDIRGNGRFRTTWTFSSGAGVVHYWFSVSTLNEADYPYAPASSRRVYVTVGPG